MNSHWHNLYQCPPRSLDEHTQKMWTRMRRCVFPKGNQSVITKRRKGKKTTKKQRLDRQKITDVYNKWYILHLLFCNMLLYPFSSCCNHVFYSELYTAALFSWAQGKWIVSCHISVPSTVWLLRRPLVHLLYKEILLGVPISDQKGHIYDSYFFWFLPPLDPTLYFHVFFSPTEMGETEASIYPDWNCVK